MDYWHLIMDMPEEVFRQVFQDLARTEAFSGVCSGDVRKESIARLMEECRNLKIAEEFWQDAETLKMTMRAVATRMARNW